MKMNGNMEHNKILAVIITYNPDISILKSNIAALYPQVDYITIYDNASDNVKLISKVTSKYKNITLIKNKKNEGLPINYNRGLRFCLDNGYEWLLTMDQDTIVPADLIINYSKVFNNEKVAIISPVLVDINIQTEEEVRLTLPDENYTEIRYCISSASLNRVSILKELGGFDEKLFIDQVDFDYCRNVLNHGYKIFRMNHSFIAHQVGQGRKIRILGKEEVAYNHSPFRKYYFFRNRIYFARKYHITLFNEPVYYRNLVKHFLVLFYEDQKNEKFKQVFKGIRDGFKL